MIKFCLYFLAAWLTVFGTAFSDSGCVQSTANTSVELFHDGKNTVIAEFTIKPGWHIYWNNPGEIGLPTVVTAKNSDIQTVNQSIPQVRTVYEVMHEYLYENNAYFELRLSNPKEAEITFDFVECRDVCKPEKLTFDLKKVPSAKEKVLKKIKAAARATFPRKMRLSGSDGNEVLIDSGGGEVRFIPADKDIIDEESVEISDSGGKTSVKWRQSGEKRLEKALIFIGDDAYIAEISYGGGHLLYMILLAFAGGIILNAMPCVFPILSLKIFTLLRSRRTGRKRARLNALLYTLGVLASFWLLSGCLALLKSGGEAAGWGFQLQSPWFVGIMSVIFFVLFLYMAELFVFPGIAGRLIHKAAGLNEFTTGFFAVLVASPCTGPFMGAAVGYAFMRSDREIFAVFTALALGYALPYALIELYPQLLNRILPRPGRWMRTVKIVLSVPLLLTSLWLGGICYKQIKSTVPAAQEVQTAEAKQPYDAEKISALTANGENIFIEFTADWCLTCKFNEKIILNSGRFKKFLRDNKVHVYVADLTEGNEEYYRALFSYGRDSIPLYVYCSGGSCKVLPLFFGIKDLKVGQ